MLVLPDFCFYYVEVLTLKIIKVMKRLVLQMVFMSVCVFCAIMLNILMFVYCVEHQGSLNYAHAAFGSLFCFAAVWCARILCDLGHEYQELKECEYEQHLLDADDYASREL